MINRFFLVLAICCFAVVLSSVENFRYTICPESCECGFAEVHVNGVTVNCAGTDLEAVPFPFSTNMVSINLDGNDIEHLRGFHNYKELRILRASNNLVEVINSKAFIGLKHLFLFFLPRLEPNLEIRRRRFQRSG